MGDTIERLVYSVEEAAEAAGMSRTKLFAEIRDGNIVARKHGRRTLIERSEMERFVKSLPKTGSPEEG